MHRFTSLILICLVAGAAFGQWVVRPTGSTETWYGVAARGLQGVTVVGTNATILYTEDDGFDWGPQQGEADVEYHAVSFANHDTGLVAGTSGTILFTTNAGDTWQTKETGWMHPYHAAEQATPQIGAVAGINSVFQPIFGVSTDGWLTHDFYVFYPQQGDTMYEGSVTDLYYIPAAQVWLATVAVWDGEGAICRSSDGGSTWQTVAWDSDALHAIDGWDAEHIVAAGANGRVLLSSNAGGDWQSLTAPTNLTLTGVSFGTMTDVWAVGQSGLILYSSNAGVDWVSQSSTVDADLRAVSFINADTGYAAGDNGIVLYTANGGGLPPNNPPGEFFRVQPYDSSEQIGQLPIYMVWTAPVDPDGDALTYILRIWSSDHPEWQDSTFVSPDTQVVVHIPPPPNAFDLYTMHWTVQATDGQDTVMAVNGVGLFYVYMETGADDSRAESPRMFALSAYPNPFNPTTTLHLSLPVSSEAVVRVFDVTGRLAKETRLGRLESGSHEITFDGRDLPSGIYLAVMETPQVRLTQKLVLLK